VPERVLTEERVAEINERLRQGGLGGFLGSLVGNDSLRTTEVTYNDRAVWLAAKLGSRADSFASLRALRCVGGARANGDPKIYGGLDPLITTRYVPVSRTPPRFIDTNAEVMGMDLRATLGVRALFMPDVLLLYRHKRYEVVSYEDLSVGGGAVLCAERSPHEAAEVVGHTWVRTNLDGGPDRRYTDNTRVPVVRYHVCSIESGGAGFRLPLLLPNEDYTAAVRRFFREVFAHSLRDGPPGNADGDSTGGSREGDGRGAPRARPRGASAREVLGVGPDASEEEILAAYRGMARMYHPDRVEGLGPEFSELAERRMKEINAAYQELGGR
jgi:hypothetical protein